MPPKPKAKWSTDPKMVVARSEPDGSLHTEVPVKDTGKLVMTITIDITPERGVRVFVHGEPNAELTDFQAWSDF